MPAGPPRDAEQNIIPHNHSDILDESYVIRHTVPNDLVPNETGGKRVSSGAYSRSDDGGMSVDIEDWMIRDGLNPLHYVKDPAHGATRLRVGDLRQMGLMVGWDPKAENPHHGSVWGIGHSKARKRIARIAITVRKVLGED